MRTGTLRHRLLVEAQTTSKDVAGGVAPSWAQVGMRYGEIVPLSGRERVLAGSAQGVLQSRIRIRYFPGLSTAHRLRRADAEAAPVSERVFQITAVLDPDGKRTEHLVDVTERV